MADPVSQQQNDLLHLRRDRAEQTASDASGRFLIRWVNTAAHYSHPCAVFVRLSLPRNRIWAFRPVMSCRHDRFGLFPKSGLWREAQRNEEPLRVVPSLASGLI